MLPLPSNNALHLTRRPASLRSAGRRAGDRVTVGPANDRAPRAPSASALSTRMLCKAPMSASDARLREMQLLARLDRDQRVRATTAAQGGPPEGSAERQMIASMIADGYVNGVDTMIGVQPGMFWQAYNDKRAEQIFWVLNGGHAFPLRISHKGRIRLAELAQQLKTGRDRDDTGILWARRHVLVDLAAAILEAREDAPLSVAFLDMNGLTEINTHGHAVGDDALRAFFQAAMATLGQRGDVYRNGGDEVVAILPGVSDDGAAKLLDTFARQLSKERLPIGSVVLTLTACCGAASTPNPGEDAAALLARADHALLRAKPVSGPPKVWQGRLNAYAVADRDVCTHSPDAP